LNLFPATRLTAVAALLLLPGLYYAIRFSSGFLRMLSRKYRRGKPYLKGSASDYFLFAAGSLLIALMGAVLLTGSMLQGGFQRVSSPRKVGRVTVENLEGRRMRVELSMDPDYPSPRELSTEIVGVRWCLEGEYLDWRFVPRWLGFHPGHRLQTVLGSVAAASPVERPPDSRPLVSGEFPLAPLFRRHPSWFPLADLKTRRTPWLAATGSYRMFVGGAGYVLQEERPKEP